MIASPILPSGISRNGVVAPSGSRQVLCIIQCGKNATAIGFNLWPFALCGLFHALNGRSPERRLVLFTLLHQVKPAAQTRFYCTPFAVYAFFL